MNNNEARGASKAIHKFINDLWDELDLTDKLGFDAPDGETPREKKAETIDYLKFLMGDIGEQYFFRGADAGIRALRELVKANGGASPTRGQSKHAWRKSVRENLPDLDDFEVLDDPW